MRRLLLTIASTILDNLDTLLVGSTFHPRVVVCIPAYNEETRIGHVIREASLFANQILVCDDGSSDGTALEAEANGGRVIRHFRNLGKGAALRTLLREAEKASPDIIVTIDGDGQHSPRDIPKLLSPILDRSAEVVIGSRFGNGNAVPRYRKIGNSILSALTNMSARTSVRDTQSGFRAYSSKVIATMVISRNGMGVDSEILIKVAKEGFRIVERDVSINYEGDTSTFNPVSHMFRVMWGLFLAFVKEHFNEFAQRGSETLPLKNSAPSRLDKVGNGGFPKAENRGLTPRLNGPLQSPLTPRDTDNYHGG